MFEDSLARARQLIEQRDQIDHELRILFGEVPHPKRPRRRSDKSTTDNAEHEDPAPISPQQT